MNIHFLGGAGEVTGSKYLIDGEVRGKRCRFFVDYGMFQGGRQAIVKNLSELEISPNELDFILLTHAHIDHSGLLPRLSAKGFTGPIYCSPGTEALLKIMLLDSAHIQESNLARAYKRDKRKILKSNLGVLYSTQDATNCLKQIVSIPFGSKFSPIPGIEFEFSIAGHILGASIVSMNIETIDNDVKKIVFSGDLGMFNQPFTQDPALVDKADILLVESTYGNRLHRNLQETENELVNVINQTISGGGNIIIPSFAVGRTQEILFILSDLVKRGFIDKLNIWVDSPMATAVSMLTSHYFAEFDPNVKDIAEWISKNKDLVNIRFTQSVEESKSINLIRGGAVILSASGMCEAGRILHHLKNNLPHKNNAVIISGFQAEGSLGRKLVDGQKSVRIMGEECKVLASIHTIGGLSAHADQSNLIRWLSGFKSEPDATFIVHGEAEASAEFLSKIQEVLHWRNLEIPQLGEKRNII
jgi:metallo-beta-lactamase family protein